MLADVGFWLIISSVLGSISIWSFFPRLGVSGIPYFIFLGLMFVGAILWFVFSIDRIKVWIKKRSTQYVLSLLVMAICSLVLIGFLNWGSVQLTEKSHWYKDYTKAQLYTLSDQTIEVLSTLKEKVSLQVWTTNIQSMGETRDMKTFLDAYQGNSKGKLTLEILNPQAKFAEATKLNIKRNNIIVIKALESNREIRIENFEEKKGEEQITNGLISALRGQKKTACFLAGYGGPLLDVKDAEGLSFLKEDLESSSYQILEVTLGTVEKMPPACELILLVGPRGAPNERDVKMIKESVEAGTPMAAFIGATSHKGWKELTKEYGITVRDDMVINPLRPNSPQMVDTANYARDIEIVKNFRLRTTHFGVSSLILPMQAKSGDSVIRAFVSTEPMAYAKKIDLTRSKNLDIRRSPDDLSGAMPIAALFERRIDATIPDPSINPTPKTAPDKIKSLPVKKEEPKKTSWLERLLDMMVPAAQAQEGHEGHEGMPDSDMSFNEEAPSAAATPGKKMMRIVVFSSDLFVSNALIEQGGNRDLVLNSISYLLQDSGTLGIRPRDIGEVRLAIKPYDDRKVFGALFLVSLGFMFFAVRAAGRRSRLKAA